MEGNREEADRALQIARQHREQGKFSSALKFAKKSLSLYETPAAVTLIKVIEKDIQSAASSTANGSAEGSSAKTSSAEVHPSAAGTHHRPGHGSTTAGTSASGSASSSKKREYTDAQHKLVKRITACKVTEYYEILSVKRECSDDEVKKAYRKLALQLHPDKNGAPGADEAFKMVSKSFTILSDKNLRAVYDANPRADPSSRGGGGGGAGMARGFGGGGMNGQHFQGEMDPAELFNMFFGGGGFGGGGQPIFTTSFGGNGFGAGSGFQSFGAQQARARARQRNNEQETTPPSWVQMLPLILVGLFALATIFSSLFGFGPVDDPRFSYTPHTAYTAMRQTHSLGIPYYVNQAEFERHPIWESIPDERRSEPRAGRWSQPLRKFESGVDNSYVVNLREECDIQRQNKQRRIQANQGFFGVGADWDKIREINAEPLASCDRLRQLGYGAR